MSEPLIVARHGRAADIVAQDERKQMGSAYAKAVEALVQFRAQLGDSGLAAAVEEARTLHLVVGKDGLEMETKR